MDGYMKFMNELPLWAKIVFALPCLDILWNIYRLFASLKNKNTLGIVLAIAIILFFSWNLIAIFDIVMLILKGKIWWLD